MNMQKPRIHSFVEEDGDQVWTTAEGGQGPTWVDGWISKIFLSTAYQLSVAY